MSVTAEIPDRLSVPVCIGCGAMNVFFTCPDGCHEIRLDLIPAETFDVMLAAGGGLTAAAAAFSEIAAAAAGEPPGADFEAAYRQLQTRARKALHDHPDAFTETPEWVGEVRARATSWCPVCGGLDAPMECIDVCRLGPGRVGRQRSLPGGARRAAARVGSASAACARWSVSSRT